MSQQLLSLAAPNGVDQDIFFSSDCSRMTELDGENFRVFEWKIGEFSLRFRWFGRFA
jgi:hypothetical protein